ncbi:MAG: FMN-binding protein [Nevskia sp.]|nr:FMN-binding protein [Nevskia sp.]
MTPSSRLLLLPFAAVAVCAPAHAMVYLSVEEAQKLMFGDQALTPLPLSLSPQQVAAVEKDAGVKFFPGSLRAWKGADGYFFVDAVIGKHDLITYAVALGQDGKVRQVEILEYREAYGGDVRNPRWRKQFTGKQHGDPLHLGEDIQGISGATLSCEHVTDGIRRLLSVYDIAIRPR